MCTVAELSPKPRCSTFIQRWSSSNKVHEVCGRSRASMSFKDGILAAHDQPTPFCILSISPLRWICSETYSKETWANMLGMSSHLKNQMDRLDPDHSQTKPQTGWRTKNRSWSVETPEGPSNDRCMYFKWSELTEFANRVHHRATCSPTKGAYEMHKPSAVSFP